MSSSTSQPVDRLAIGAALVTVVLWASAFVGIRAVAADLTPGSIAIGRLLVAAISLTPLVAVRPWVRPTRREVALIVGFGLVWFAVYNLALNEAERNVDAGTAAMLVNTGPIFIAIFAGIFLGEGFPGRLLLGCLVAFVGTLIIGVATSTAGGVGGNTPLGIALCFVAALAYAAGMTLQKPAVRRLPATSSRGWRASWARARVSPFTPASCARLGAAAPVNAVWLVYLGLFPTAMGFAAWAFALGSPDACGASGGSPSSSRPWSWSWAAAVLAGTRYRSRSWAARCACAGVAVARSTRALLPRLRPA